MLHIFYDYKFILSGTIIGISKYVEVILSKEFTLKDAIRRNIDMLVKKLFPDKVLTALKNGSLEEKTQHLFELLAFHKDFTDDFIAVFFAVNESKAVAMVREAIEAEFPPEMPNAHGIEGEKNISDSG